MIKDSTTEDNSIDENNNLLLAQIRECFGRVVYSHKTHEKQADLLLTKDASWKWVQIILSALVSTSFFATLGNCCCIKKECILFAGAFLSVAATVLNLCFKNFDYGSKAQRHKETAVQLWNIRESYLSLITDYQNEKIDDSKAMKIRDELQNNLRKIYEQEPRTTSKAYCQAQKALKVNEDLTFSPDEIDQFLPESLRTKKKGTIK